VTSEDWSIISNVFPGSLTYRDTSKQLDTFYLEGVGSGTSKYKIIGKMIYKLEWDNKTSLVHYSEKEKNYAVGFLKSDPVQEQVNIGSAKATYAGILDLDDGISGRKAIASLLNKTKETSAKGVLWKGALHTYFPVEAIDLTADYQRPLMLFRGPRYRYNVLNDERIVLSLDVATRYVDSRPYLEYINSSGLDSLQREIDSTKREMKKLRKTSRGVHFFYSLVPMDVGIDGVDDRPISKIPLNENQTIAEYLDSKHGKQKPQDWLDRTQPGLRSGEITYAPQFLYKNVQFQDVPSEITAEHTYYTDDAPRKNRDPEHTAQTRWEKTMDLFEDYGFSSLRLGPHQIEFGNPLEFPASNRIPLPKLVASSKKTVPPSKIRDEIRKGLYEEAHINKAFLYSSGKREVALSFYSAMIGHAKEYFNFRLPENPTLLESDPKVMENQLRRSLELEAENAIVIAIVDEGTDIHDMITNTCGRLRVPSKCITTRTVMQVVKQRRSFPLAGYLASLLTRAKCIPWVLASHLSYDCYIATDVGRAKSENWVMMIVYDKMGKYEIGQTKLTVGESIDRDSLTACMEDVKTLVPDVKSLLYLRDGSIFNRERDDFEFVMKKSEIEHSAILAVREVTPFRIYRGSLSDIWRPHSGDYYVLDESNMVLCAAGADEYEHGTPSPITIDFIPVIGSIDKFKALEDVFKLSYLNWGSPGKSYSTPAPLRMAHRIARELSLGIERSTVPF